MPIYIQPPTREASTRAGVERQNSLPPIERSPISGPKTSLKEYSSAQKTLPSYSNTPTAIYDNKPKFSQYPYPGVVHQSYPASINITKQRSENVTEKAISVKKDAKPTYVI